MRIQLRTRIISQEPVLPLRRKTPKKLENEVQKSEIYFSPKEYFRHLYFTFIEMMICQLKRRFDQPTFSILLEIESLIIGSCNGVEIQPSCTFRELYSGDLNLDRLAIQLALLPDVVKTASAHYHQGVNKVTSINTVCEIFNTCSFPKTLM